MQSMYTKAGERMDHEWIMSKEGLKFLEEDSVWVRMG